MGELVFRRDRIRGCRARRRTGYEGLERVQAVFRRVSSIKTTMTQDNTDSSDTGYRYASAPEGDEDAICPAFQRESAKRTRSDGLVLTPRDRGSLRSNDFVPLTPLHGIFAAVPQDHPLHLAGPIHHDVVTALFAGRRAGAAPDHAQ